MAERIQRRRERGWRMPAGAVYVGRPSRWGNPFVVEGIGWTDWKVFDADGSLPAEYFTIRARAHERAVELFRLHTGPMGNYEYGDELLTKLRRDLGGRDLCCWCPLELACHATVLLERANPPVTP